MEYLIIPVIGGFLMFIIIKLLVRTPGKILQSKFQALGNMKGMNKSVIIQKCGNFKSVKNIEGGSVCVWMATGYLIALVFDINNNVIKVGSETVS